MSQRELHNCSNVVLLMTAPIHSCRSFGQYIWPLELIDKRGRGEGLFITGRVFFNDAWSVLKVPACEVLTVINIPPPHLSEGRFIMVHRSEHYTCLSYYLTNNGSYT